MRRRLSLGAVLVALALLAGAGRAAAAATWHSQQPPGGGGFPLLGEVGDIQCWNGQANRCLLITAGNGGVGAGLFAYDGNGWYRYSTVCGGHQGRIAWVGPSEFWTISDLQVKPPGGLFSPSAPWNVSLCHFKEGRVVASYAEPLGTADTYLHMTGAACAGPSDCWFGGERLGTQSSVNPGAFHLHWNGASLTAVPSRSQPQPALLDPGRSVSDLVNEGGRFFEAVGVAADDVPSPEEEERGEPSFLHAIEPGQPQLFRPLFGEAPLDYGSPLARAEELQGFRLAAANGGGLWAVAGARHGAGAPEALVTVLRLSAAGALTQLHLEPPLGPGLEVGGIATEPGLDSAWVTVRRNDQEPSPRSSALLARISGEGGVETEELPRAGEEADGEPLGRKGAAGAVACPGPEQCWMATLSGWLFHLGPDPEPQEDPAMHVLVTSRPTDDSVPVVPPLELPEDDSGANRAPSGQETLPSQFEEPPRRLPALLSKIKQRLVGGGSVLEMSFTLTGGAKVQLVARRHGKVVAKTPTYKMGKGRHSLRLSLDPKRWPTKLDLRATALKGGRSK